MNKTKNLCINFFMALSAIILTMQVNAVPRDDVDPPLPDPPPETIPYAPYLKAIWKDQNAIKLQWVDISQVEYGYRLQQMNSSGGWTTIGSFQALDGSVRTQSHVVDNLAANTRYCFQALAYNNYGYSGPANRQQVCTYTGTPSSCPGPVIENVLARATASSASATITCDLTFEPWQQISKRLIFFGEDSSGVTVDLNGATLSGKGTVNDSAEMIQVISEESVVRNTEFQISSYRRPENITIKNGTLYGKLRVWGMSRNGQGDEEDGVAHSNQFKKSSRLEGHTERARVNAPTNIVFDNLTIDATGTVYFGPGVTNSKIINSELKGGSSRSAIYLDTESTGNVIKNNYIHTATDSDSWGEIPGVTNRGWPLIAVDGSSRNKIVNNWFSSLNNGGIYLYRNCGEGGVIRHATPSYNHIINNVFYYVNYVGSKPSVYLSSRNYGWKESTFGHCDKDDGYPFGSSASNRDFARFNVVMQNQIFETSKPLIFPRIATKNPSLNSPNFIDYNEMVTQQTVQRNRPAGCYVETDGRGFLFDGEFYDEYVSSFITYRHTCANGDMQRRTIYNWWQQYQQQYYKTQP